MTIRHATDAAPGTGEQDRGNAHDTGHLGSDDVSWESTRWRDHFVQTASRVRSVTNATTYLDVGCAQGLFVQALRAHGLDARGVDASSAAVESAHDDVREHLRVGSLTDPIEGRYDLISCLEVLEHLTPADAELALDAICAATDTVFFSSSPSGFAEPTHINVRTTADWAAAFAERGFYRRTDVNVDFLTPWAVLFSRGTPSSRELVHRYEVQYAPLHDEVVEKRAALLEAHQEVARLLGAGDATRISALQDEIVELNNRLRESKTVAINARHEVLTTRDHVIGLEAKADQLNVRLESHRRRLKAVDAKIKDLQQRLTRQRRRADDNQRQLEELQGSRALAVGRALRRPLRGGR